MLKTGSEIAKQKGVSKQAVNDYIRKNSIQASGKKGSYPTYDTEKEPLASYLAASPRPAKSQKPSQSETPATPAQPAPPPSAGAETAISQALKPLNNFLLGQSTLGERPAEYLFARALKLAQDNQDASLYFKLAQLAQKEQADEALRQAALKTEQAKENIAQGRAKRIQLEYEIRRGEYLEKSIVKTLFGRIYAVHTSILMPLSLKLASTLAAIPPGEGKEAAMKKLVDDEVLAALETIKRQLADYIRVGEELIDNKAD